MAAYRVNDIKSVAKRLVWGHFSRKSQNPTKPKIRTGT
jgi:hypothetical protein